MKNLAILLLLCSCGSQSPPSSFTVGYGELPPHLLGRTDYDSRSIVITSGVPMSHQALVSLLAHELMHAIGYPSGHPIKCSGCLGHAYAPWPTTPCSADVAWMQENAPASLTTLVVGDPGLYQATLEAAWLWESVLGRDLFSVTVGY